MNNLFPFLTDSQFSLVVKIPYLILLFLFIVFMFIALSQVRALDRLVKIKAGAESFIIQSIFLLYFLFLISLFLAALVIL